MSKKKGRDPRVKVPKLKWRIKRAKKVEKTDAVGKYKTGR